MVDEFMVCVDRIISSSAACFEPSALNQTDRQQQTVLLSDSTANNNSENGGGNGKVCLDGSGNTPNEGGDDEGCSSKIVWECRICQEEDEEQDMESPCACNGTLKFAHRKCIQKWCNKKGDITCEICNQIFSPNYTLPPARSNPDVMAIDIRQAWGTHIDLRDPHLLALAAAERQFLQSEYDDYVIANSRTLACFRSVAIIMMLLLLVRQGLMVIRGFGVVPESSAFFHIQFLLLQLAGFLLPCYVVARSCYIVQCQRRRQQR